MKTARMPLFLPILAVLLLPLLALAGCNRGPTTTSSSVVEQMQKVSRLETAVFTVQSVVEYEAEKPDDPLRRYLPQELTGESLLLIAQGNVIAGIDMSKLTEQDVTISEEGTVLTVRLPPVEVFTVDVDSQNTRTYSHSRGLLAPENITIADEARVVAEGRILATACDMEIMQFATENSTHSMEQLLGMLDFESVEVIPSQVPTCPTEVP